jgi:hypothetical protein
MKLLFPVIVTISVIRVSILVAVMFIVQAGNRSTFVESVVSCSLLMLRSAMLRLTSFAVCD